MFLLKLIRKPIRRSLMNKSPTPNTLSVHVPYSSLGQSLPNLTLATSPQTSTVSPTPPNSLLIVPQMTKSKDTLLSPGHRGSNYRRESLCLWLSDSFKAKTFQWELPVIPRSHARRLDHKCTQIRLYKYIT